MKWKDETSFGRYDKDRTPRVWAVVNDPLRLKVHRLHGIDATWFASCDLFERRQLVNTEVEMAKLEAVALVTYQLRSALATYGVLGTLNEQPKEPR
jgi:hypothetical protein